MLLVWGVWLLLFVWLPLLPKVEILDLSELLQEALGSFDEATRALVRLVGKAYLLLVFLVFLFVSVFVFGMFRCPVVGLDLHRKLVAVRIRLLFQAL